MRKVERLVNLTALLLDTPRPLTLDEVAEMVPGYEASGESLRRMFERDKEELRGLGVPVERAAVDAWQRGRLLHRPQGLRHARAGPRP
jgi:proteasome accessory factor B